MIKNFKEYIYNDLLNLYGDHYIKCEYPTFKIELEGPVGEVYLNKNKLQFRAEMQDIVQTLKLGKTFSLWVFAYEADDPLNAKYMDKLFRVI